MFRPGVLDWPIGEKTIAVEDAKFTPPEIKDVLLAYTAQTISLAFPDADPADSIRYCKLDPKKVVYRIDIDLVYKVYLEEAPKRDDLNAELAQFEEVQFCHNNGTIELDTNDPYFSNQWNLHNTGQTGGTPDADIDMPEAWELEQGDPVATIGILDTGLMPNHPDLSGKVTGDGIVGIHGTHVGGIAAANTNNGVGIAGVG
jgi:subtilisin family serine protease